VLVAADHPVELLNPLRSRRFQEQDLPRAPGPTRSRSASPGSRVMHPGGDPARRGRQRGAGLTPIGHVRPGSVLWMPVLTAVMRRNPWVRAFYERLIARGKPAKLALVAALRKLLHAVHSVARHRRPFVPVG
jgi:hypothetical protein